MANAKFNELLLYVAQKCADDALFGMVKLNKILFYSDFEHFYRHRESITDAEYQHLPQGPAARATLPAIRELVDSGCAEIEHRNFHGKTQKRLIAKRDPILTLFTQEQLDIVDLFIRQFWNLNASETSELSHDNAPGWRVTENGEKIPYEMAFVSDEQPSEQELLEKYGFSPERLAEAEAAAKRGERRPYPSVDTE
ncbi:MAG: Panacea domain-containing protein [Candidatus Xenobia bacterium]